MVPFENDCADNGSALVTWLEASAPEARVLARTVTPDGQVGPGFLVSRVSDERASSFPRAAFLGDRPLFAWTDPG